MPSATSSPRRRMSGATSSLPPALAAAVTLATARTAQPRKRTLTLAEASAAVATYGGASTARAATG